MSEPEDREYEESERIAKTFHDVYERLAPSYGYKTRDATRVPWDQLPENNRLLMISTVATVRAVLEDRSASLVKALREENDQLKRKVVELIGGKVPSVPAVSAEEE